MQQPDDGLIALATQLITGVVEHLQTEPRALEPFLDARGVTNGGDLTAISELLLYSLFPIDAQAERLLSEGDGDWLRTYLRLGIVSIIIDAAQSANALRADVGDVEAAFKARINQRFSEYTEALNTRESASAMERASDLARMASVRISARPDADPEVIDRLAEYFLSQMQFAGALIRAR